jgi:two-component sensor histidine kinase
LKSYIEKVINCGVRQSYAPWEVHLTRKLNTILLIAFFNIFIGLVFFYAFGYYSFLLDCVLALLIGPILFVLNRYLNYIWAAYWFFLVGYVFFISMNLKMGKDTYMMLFYFPVIISLVQLLGRKETLKHMIVLAILCLVSVAIIAVGFKYQWVDAVLNGQAISNVMIMDIVLSIFTTIAFIIVVVTESMAQERLIKNMLTEKEVLLSEVFHRVKNNMNIVTSLLNLKKSSSSSIEVQDALEECRTRVFSMALVHQKIFEREHVINLDFKEYIHDLLAELMSSLGKDSKTDIVIDADVIFVELSNAIPCGLILNEFVTNSYKYAQLPGRTLQLKISLKKQNNFIELELRDNGPGLPSTITTKPNSLGMELMKSLSEQIDGQYSFSNDKGLVFKLKFKQE